MWTLIEVPPGKETIPCYILFMRKLDEVGPVALYQAHLVSKVYVQKYGIDYDYTFAPVLSFGELLPVFGKFVAMSWHVLHLDISMAFLNVDIGGELYVEWNELKYKLEKSCTN